MAHNIESENLKRKRDAIDDNGDRIPQPPPPQSGNSIPINYFSRAHNVKLKLVQGDGETLSDILTLINEYEGVLNRHESLALNLGAKLTGPHLLRAMENTFVGPIITNPPRTALTADPVTWADIVEFAKSNPGEFKLLPTPNGTRYCQFSLKGFQVEIVEDDWRLIVTGALDRLMLARQQPLEEDETTELATLDILDQRLQVLIKKADEVARKARQLNYHLSGRKATINARRSAQSASGPGFQAVNQSRLLGANSGYDLHADLLQQFSSISQPSGQRFSSVDSIGPAGNALGTTVSTPRQSIQQQQQQQQQLMPSSQSPAHQSEAAVTDAEEEIRALVTAKIDKLTRGDPIYPPCDRCRRLKTQCIKHLTACQGCTKKHARCVWKGLTEEEVVQLRGEASKEDEEEQEDEARVPSSKADVAPMQQTGFGDSKPPPGFERGEKPAGPSRPASRIAIGRRSADDVWRKGPEPASSAVGSRARDDPVVEVDLRDAAQHRHDNPPERDRDSRPSLSSGSSGHSAADLMIRHVASVASARADAAAASRGSVRPS